MLIYDAPLVASFSDVATLEALGTMSTGLASPFGIGDALTIVNGSMRSYIRDTDPLTFFGQRSEITLPVEPNAERWYTWEMFVPADFEDAVEINLQQIHDTPDGGDPAKAPNFVLVTKSGALYVVVPSAQLPTESAGSKSFFVGRLVKNKWVRYCLHINYQTNMSGMREFFIDSIPVFRQFTVPTHYVDAVGPYFKLGLYNHQHVAGFGSRTAYYRRLKSYSGAESYLNVLGSNPVTEPQMVF